MNRIILAFLFYLLTSFDNAVAKPDLKLALEGVVEINYSIKKKDLKQYGVVIAKETVITTSFSKGAKITNLSVSKLGSPALLPGTVSILGEDYPLVSIKVKGLDTKAVSLQTEFQAGKTIYALRQKEVKKPLEITPGSISDMIEYQPIKKSLLSKKEYGPKLNLLIHNALLSDSTAGTSLLNECGEFIGLSIKEPWQVDSATSQRVALSGKQIIGWLNKAKVNPTMAKAPCKGAQARVVAAEEKVKVAREKLQKAQAKAKDKAKQDKKEKEEAEKEAEQAQEKLEEMKLELEEAKRNAELSEGELTDQMKYLSLGGLLCLMVLVLLWRLNSRKKNKMLTETNNRAIEAEQAAASARQEAAVAASERNPQANFECVLHGADPDGKNHMIKIHKGVLADPQGVVLGRNPRSSKFIVSHEEVGREHARLIYDDGSLFVEDLGSTNGTYVNGVQLSPQQRTPLISGSALTLGPINFKVELI